MHLRGRVGTSVEVVLFGEVAAYIPQVGVMSTSLGALPRPVPRPLPGVTPPASPECSTPQSRGWLWGGWPCSRSLTRGWSSVWAWVLALVGARCRGLRVGLLSRPLPWRHPSGFAGVFHATNMGLVVRRSARCLLVVVVVVDGVGFVGVRCRGRGCWSRIGSSRCLPVAVVGVDCVFHKSVRCRGRGCWPRIGSW